MKASLSGIAFIGLAMAGPAIAADLPRANYYQPPAAYVAPFSWAGFYLGGNVGYSRGKDDLNVGGFDVNGVAIPGTTAASLKPAGIIGGLQAGYNWQASSSWVWGLETDFQWSGQKDSLIGTGAVSSTNCFGDASPPCSLTGTGTGTLAAKIDWLGTLRGRLGFAADRMLFYGTGGLAYGRVKTFGAASFTGTFTDSSGGTCDVGGAGCPASGSAAFSDSRTKLGWTLGAGIEGAISPASNWTWRVEYLYVDLGTANATAPFSSSVSVPGVPLTQTISGSGSSSAHVTDQIVRFGVNYKFGGDALAARY